MTTLEKAARAMRQMEVARGLAAMAPRMDTAKEAMFAARIAEALEAEHAAAISSALLDPSDEVVAYSLAAMAGTLWAAGWAETELRKIPKGALQTAFEEGLRAAGVKITGSQG